MNLLPFASWAMQSSQESFTVRNTWGRYSNPHRTPLITLAIWVRVVLLEATSCSASVSPLVTGIFAKELLGQEVKPPWHIVGIKLLNKWRKEFLKCHKVLTLICLCLTSFQRWSCSVLCPALHYSWKGCLSQHHVVCPLLRMVKYGVRVLPVVSTWRDLHIKKKHFFFIYKYVYIFGRCIYKDVHGSIDCKRKMVSNLNVHQKKDG